MSPADRRVGSQSAYTSAYGCSSPWLDARNRLSELVADVEKTHARVTITKHGHPAAVLVSPEDLASLEETLDILSDPEALADIREAEAAYSRGDVTTGEEMARSMDERRRRASGAAVALVTSCSCLVAPAEPSNTSCRWRSLSQSGSLCNGPLRDNARRVGKPLGRELTGYFSACRGAYRVVYRLVEDDAVVHVVRIEHRADVYRRR